MPGPLLAARRLTRRFRTPPLRPFLAGVLTALAVAAGAEAVRVVAGDNFHEVIPGRVYRSAQLSPAALARAADRYGIRTVLNLRGCCPEFDWYVGECRAGHDRDISQEDVFLSASRLPPPAELRRLVEALEYSEPPVLVHCRRGSDRTGLACAVAHLLFTDATPDGVRPHYSLRYGHVPVGPTVAVDRFFELYAAWLAARGVAHSPAVFRDWAFNDYCPGVCRGVLELLDAAAGPAERPRLVRVRATNASPQVWRMRAGTGTGVHARLVVFGHGGNYLHIDKAGLFDRDVPPGGSVEIALPVPALKAGRYCLQVDLIDGRGNSFAQAGSEPLMTELTAHE